MKRYDSSGALVTSATGGAVTSVTGTANRITSSGGISPVIDISAAYVGQASITTVGTITTGVWNGTDIAFANIAQLAGLSVLGVTGNSTADMAAITAGTDNQVLRRSGTALAFGAVNLASSSAITGSLPLANLDNGINASSRTWWSGGGGGTGVWTDPTSLSFVDTTATASVSNTVTETDFGITYTTPALEVGDIIRLRWSGYYDNTSATTLKNRIKLNGTAILWNGDYSGTFWFNPAAGYNKQSWIIEADIIVVSAGSPGTCEPSGIAHYDNMQAALLTWSIPMNNNPTLLPIAIDTVGGQTIDLSCEWDVANSANTQTLRTFTVEIIRAQ